MRIYIAPYKMGSASAKALAHSMNVLRVNGTKRFRPSDVIINWGKANIQTVKGSPTIINNANAIAIARNKISTLQKLKQASVPTIEFTTSRNEAMSWQDGGDIVMCRTNVTSSQGVGIIVAKEMDDIPYAPLYTKYIKAHEYRMHVYRDKVFFLQKKKRRSETECNDYIKNSNGGWVFCQEEVRAPLSVFKAAIDAVKVLGLHFGAVDVLYREADDKVAVLEVNTAPGIEGTTLQKYTEVLRENISRHSY